MSWSDIVMALYYIANCMRNTKKLKLYFYQGRDDNACMHNDVLHVSVIA